MKTLLKLIFTTSILLNINPSKAQNYVLDWATSIKGGSMCNSIDIDASGNVYSTGHFNETVDFDPGIGTYNLTSVGYEDAFIQKLDANGSLIWAKTMGGPGHDVGRSIRIDASGDIYVTGHFSGIVDFDPGVGTYNLISAGYDDAFIQKLDSNGNFIWAKAMGGPNGERSHSIMTDAMGNIYTTGIFQGTVDFDPGTGIYDLNSANSLGVFIQKMDALGNFIWAKGISSVSSGSSGAINHGSSVTIDPFGDVYITGSFTGTADFDPGSGIYNLTAVGVQDIFILKLDADGDFIWAKAMGGASYDVGLSITTDSSGNVYTTGSFQDTTDFDPGTGIHNITAIGLYDIFIQKLDLEGNFLWTKTIGSTSNEQGLSITTDNQGNIYTTGYFSGAMDFDPGIGTYNITAMGFEDIFVQKLDTDGHFLWAESIGGGSFEIGNTITVDTMGNVYTGGYFSGTLDFDPDTGIYNLTAISSMSNAFIQKLKDDVEDNMEDSLDNIGIHPFIYTESINFYPNPTYGKITVEGNEIQHITVTDIHGKIVQQLNVSNKTTEIDLSHKAKGMYFLKIKTDDKMVVKKILLK